MAKNRKNISTIEETDGVQGTRQKINPVDEAIPEDVKEDIVSVIKPQKITVNVPRLYLRSTPSIANNNNIVTIVEKGTIIDCVDVINDEWISVKFKCSILYCMRQFVTEG